MNTQANKNQLKVSGGTTGQALVKTSNTDYDYDWADVVGGGGGGGGGGTLIDSNSTQQSVAQNVVGTTETTLYTIAIPAGTLGVKNALRTTVMFDDSLNLNNGAIATIRVRYGGTIVGAAAVGTSGATLSGGLTMKLENILLEAGTTSSQKSYTKLSLSQGGITLQSTTPQISYNGDTNQYTSTSVDSTINQNLTVTVEYNATANSLMVAEAIIVEKITGQTTANAVVERISNVPPGDEKLLFIGNYLLQFDSTTAVSQYFLYERDSVTSQYKGVGTVTIDLPSMPVTYTGNAVLSTDGTKLYAKTVSSGSARLAAVVEVNVTTGALLTVPCLIDATIYLVPTKDFFISGGLAYLQEQNAPYAWGECTYTPATSQTLGVTAFSIPTTGTLGYPILNVLGDFALYNETSGANILKKVQVSTNTITTYTYCPTDTAVNGAVIIGNTIAVARVLPRDLKYDIEIVYISN